MGKLYTRRGDGGETDLLGGEPVAKNDPRVEACGGVDELNCAIGWASAAAPGEIRATLAAVQQELFELGVEVAAPAGPDGRPVARLTGEHVGRLEAEIDRLTLLLPPLKNFIVPGGSECAARLHVARAMCRRAERAVVALAGAGAVSGQAIAYLNRVSDLLFALARRCNQLAGVAELVWPSGTGDGAKAKE